jgi:hypothetical protein
MYYILRCIGFLNLFEKLENTEVERIPNFNIRHDYYSICVFPFSLCAKVSSKRIIKPACFANNAKSKQKYNIKTLYFLHFFLS